MKIGDRVIINKPQSVWHRYNGYVTYVWGHIAEVELCATGHRVCIKPEYLVKCNESWSSSGNEVRDADCDENDENMADKNLRLGDTVIINRRGHEADGCLGTVMKIDEDRDIVVVSVAFSTDGEPDEVKKYAFGLDEVEHIKDITMDRNVKDSMVKYVKTELTMVAYEKLNVIKEKYRIFSNKNIAHVNDYYLIGTLAGAREFCEALIICTQYGLTMDDEDDEFIIRLCEKLGWDDLLEDMYSLKIGDEMRAR